MKTTTKTIYLDGESLTLDDIKEVAQGFTKVDLSPEAVNKVKNSRNIIEEIIKSGEHVYGVNTGFGALSSVAIPDNQLEDLQTNLIRSHACGVGEPFPTDVTRAIILLRANTLAKGYSGIRLETLQTMLDLLNKQVHPIIPRQGSVGASGDLVPLAHLALVLLGEGKAIYQGKELTGAQALELAGIKPILLGAKEGLALTNGTQAMCGMGVIQLLKAEKLTKIADIAGAMTVEATKGTTRAFLPQIQALRQHKGQMTVSDNLLKILNESEVAQSHKNCDKIQDPYSLRCMPQVHGATRDVLSYVRNVLEIEINSATDNPLIFPDSKDVISGGNFHGQPLAFAMDFLGIAIAELANVSERRIDKLITPNFSGLPPFLTKEFGLNSGHMIVQYAAASLVSENKVLAHPASVDSIPTSLDKEDHVSMGATSAVKSEKIITNTKNVLAMEFLAASQGLGFLEPLKPGKGVEAAYKLIRQHIPFAQKDRIFSDDIHVIAELIDNEAILNEVQKSIGILK